MLRPGYIFDNHKRLVGLLDLLVEVVLFRRLVHQEMEHPYQPLVIIEYVSRSKHMTSRS